MRSFPIAVAEASAFEEDLDSLFRETTTTTDSVEGGDSKTNRLSTTECHQTTSDGEPVVSAPVSESLKTSDFDLDVSPAMAASALNEEDAAEEFNGDWATSKVPRTVTNIVEMLNELPPAQLNVKLFVTNSPDSQWEERGVGILSIAPSRQGALRLVVSRKTPVSKKSASLLDTQIDQNNSYAAEGQNIISWNDGSSPYSLSFASADARGYTWEIIQLVVPDRISGEEDDDEEDGSGDHVDEHTDDEYCGDWDLSTGEPSGSLGMRQVFLEDFRGDYREIQPRVLNSAALNSVNRITTRLESPPRNCMQLMSIVKSLRMVERCTAACPGEATKVIQQITRAEWLKKFWDLFHSARRDESYQTCSLCAEVLCRIVSIYALTSNPFIGLAQSSSTHCLTQPGSPARGLNASDPLVRLLSNEHFENFFRVMEYEPELRKHSVKVDHVNFLKNCSEFREVICSEDNTFKVSCHFIYRILYLRDVCLPRHLDELTIQRLGLIINSGYTYLCRIINLRSNCLETLRDMIPHDVMAARFLLQLLSVLRPVNAAQSEKSLLFGAVRRCGILDALVDYLTGNCPAAEKYRRLMRETREAQIEAEKRMRAIIQEDRARQHRPELLSHDRLGIPTLQEIAVEIIQLITEYNPSIFRSAILSQANASPGPPKLWTALCKVFRTTDNEGVHTQVAEIFRRVLDPEIIESPERDDFLSTFYDTGVIDQLIAIALTPPPTSFSDLVPTAANPNPVYFIPGLSDDESDEDVEPSTLDTRETPFRTDDVVEDEILVPGASAAVASTPGPKPRPPPGGSLSDDELLSSGSPGAPVRRERCSISLPPAKRRASASLSGRPVPGRVCDSPTLRSSARSQSVPRSSSRHSSLQWTNSTDNNAVSDSPPSGSPSSAVWSRSARRLERLSRGEQEALLTASRAQLSFVKCQISEILSCCVLKHNYRSQYRTLQQGLHVHLIHLSFDPMFDMFLAIYAVKFLRACVRAQAEYYTRMFIRHDVFQPVLFLLRERVTKPTCRGEGSVLESVIFDFFKTIMTLAPKSSAIASLLQFLFEHHEEDIVALSDYYATHCNFHLFYQMRAAYEESLRRTQLWAAAAFDREMEEEGSRSRRRPSIPKDSAEYERNMQDMYFSSVDDNDTTYSSYMAADDQPESTTAPSARLLSYDDDDDEDDSEVSDFLKPRTSQADDSSSLTNKWKHSSEAETARRNSCFPHVALKKRA